MQTHHARALLSQVAGRGEGGEGPGEVPDESAPAPPRGEQATAAVSEEAGCRAERLDVTSVHFAPSDILWVWSCPVTVRS